MYGGYYVQKIEGLGEFDKGAKSGWMYRVNGVYPEAVSYTHLDVYKRQVI